MGSHRESLHPQSHCLMSHRRPLCPQQWPPPSSSLPLSNQGLISWDQPERPSFPLGPRLDPVHGPLLCSQLFHGFQRHLNAQEPENPMALASLQPRDPRASSGCVPRSDSSTSEQCPPSPVAEGTRDPLKLHITASVHSPSIHYSTEDSNTNSTKQGHAQRSDVAAGSPRDVLLKTLII